MTVEEIGSDMPVSIPAQQQPAERILKVEELAITETPPTETGTGTLLDLFA